jgi:hypothetical protein
MMQLGVMSWYRCRRVIIMLLFVAMAVMLVPFCQHMARYIYVWGLHLLSRLVLVLDSCTATGAGRQHDVELLCLIAASLLFWDT